MNLPAQTTATPHVPGAEHLDLPWLLADIGGTNARFAWMQSPDQGLEHVHTLVVADYVTPDQACRNYLARVAKAEGVSQVKPRRAAIAVASNVQGDAVVMTNSHWSFSSSALQESLGVKRLLLLNDFEALALSLPKLHSHQVKAWGQPPQARGTLAVVGPGTGLGVAGVVQTGRGWLALPGEGGHATLAPMDSFESELLAHVRRSHTHVSAERLLSGIGLPLLHEAMSAVLGETAPALSTAAIVERGVSGADPLCSKTLDTFCALLGGFCGNVVLTLGARGGLYVGGGIVPRMADQFFASRFRERFEAKGRFSSYLQPIPTMLITDTLSALTGAAFALEQLEC